MRPVATALRQSAASSSTALAASIAALDWARIAAELDAHGCATTGVLLSREQCEALEAAYQSPHPDPPTQPGLARLAQHSAQVGQARLAAGATFRSRVVMARHGFGRGEYKYFAYPLPELVSVLRTALYPALSVIANRWNEMMGVGARYPADHASYLARCAAAGQTKPTPLLLQYGPGDYNCLHQDLYGDLVFPLQATVLLSQPRHDFSGGEFVLTEQRPRMQSRAEVVPLAEGEAVIFPVHHRPVRGTRGSYRVNMRHGVSRIRSGRRYTLGIIFHDAA